MEACISHLGDFILRFAYRRAARLRETKLDTDPEIFSDLVGLLYDGLLCPEHGNELLGEVCDRLDCERASIGFHDFENQAPAVGFSCGLSQEQINQWNSHFGKKNPRSLEMRQGVMKNGCWVSANSLRNAHPAYRGSEYVEWLYEHDLYHSIVVAVQTGQDFISLNLIRPKSAKPFSEGAQMLMRRLVPHFRRAIELQRGNEALLARLQAATMALDSLDSAAMAVDARGRIVMMNEAAKLMLGSGRGLTLREGKLVAQDASQNSSLDRLLISAAMNGVGNTGAITIYGDRCSRPLSVVAMPLRSKSVFAPERPSALVFVYDPAAKPGSRAVALRNLFGLTPAESRLADLLNEEMNLNQAAARMSVTLGTARFMLKNIFSKTSTRRQSQLLQMLSRLPGE